MCPAKSSRSATKSASRKHSPSVGDFLRTYQSKRDFTVTDEPSGAESAKRSGDSLAFVIQKHAASHLHFDLRLEVDGVMRSWAVPKGPSVDPDVKRLAMEVEDHPMAYNTFEGTIPQGEYGGGTVMLWDRGTYAPDEINAGESDNDAARRALKAGKLAFTFHGERLHGSFALVRTRRGEERAQWLLFKHKDRYAKVGRDIVASVTTSVATGRPMEEIAAADSKELSALDAKDTAVSPMQPTKSAAAIPAGDYALAAEPGGERVLVFLTNGTVKLTAGSTTRSALDTAVLAESPRVSAALLRVARKIKGALILDGYIAHDVLTVVDVLLEGEDWLVDEPWIERQERLLSVLATHFAASRGQRSAIVANDWVVGSARDFKAAGARSSVNSYIAKRIDSPYESGTSKYWLRVSA